MIKIENRWFCIAYSKQMKPFEMLNNRRTKSDYDSYVEIEHEIVLEMFDEMKNFVETIKSHLNKS